MRFNDFNSKSLLSVLSGITFLLISCQKDPFKIFKDGNANAGKPVILVAGNELIDSHYVAKYWIDGQGIMLSDGTHDATANSIFVSDNDVYIAGTDNGAVYWKNNREIRLSDGSANSIFVAGNDVYVAGSNGSDSPNAVYWKNGIEVQLEKNNVYGNWGSFGANSIFVSGNDVYVAGFEGPNPVYWKNGKEIYLDFSTIGTAGFIHARSIFVSGQDVYVDGYGVTPGSPFQVFWYAVNGVFQTHITNPFSPGPGNSLFVSGSHVYIGGTQETPPHYPPSAAYWKDGNVISLPKSEINSFGNAIAASGNHVYVAGYEYASNQSTTAVYWKDSVEIKLTDGTHLATANSIFVK